MAVLIFEKSQDLAKRLIDLIKDEGNESQIFTADSFADAVMLLQNIDPNVVLMDMYFSENLSRDLLHMIKRKNIKILVILMYTYASEQHLQQCMLMGADHLINKYDDFQKIPGIISKNNEHPFK